MKRAESTIIRCPSIELLERFLVQNGSGEESESLEVHIETCKKCQTHLWELTEQSPIFARIRATGETFDGEKASLPERAHLIARLMKTKPAEITNGALNGFADNQSFPELDGYEILNEIGRGAAGIVYKARHCELNRFVALKIFPVGAYVSGDALHRFRQEAMVIARLRHPNIVQVYAIGEQNGCRFLSLELVEGGNLASWLCGVPRPIVDSTKIVESLARAIDYAHSRGVIHRDLKPSNVLLGFKSDRQSTFQITGNESVDFSNFDLKITDFGLAKTLGSFDQANDQSIQTGMIVGTPAYVAPEQARGESHEVGPAADIYALGAILYELLTGRPPFRGATAMETLLLAVHEEPASLKRLARRVPRDLETICLKCLEKDIRKRYATASELAADLERFRKHEPIQARPLGRMERCLRWAIRRPLRTASLAIAVFLVVALVVGGVSMKFKNAAIVRAEEENLREVTRLQFENKWSEANARLEQAKARISSTTPPALQELLERLDLVRRNHELLARLDAIRLERASVVNAPFNNAQADQDYEIAFRESGLMGAHDETTAIANRIAGSPIRESLLAAMDDWAVCTSNRERQIHLMEIARKTDPDVWRDRVRDPVAWGNRETLAELAESAPVAGQSVQLLVALGDRLQATGGNAVDFLNRVQQEYPADFWANFFLGTALAKKKSPDAVRYFQAALAIRPGSVAVYDGLGGELRSMGRIDEAMDQYRKAIQINPDYGLVYINFGGALRAQGRLAEAIEQYRRAIQIYPQFAWGHYVFGNALREMGKLNEAVIQYQQALTLNPKLTQAHSDLAMALISLGRHSEAIDQCQQAIKLSPKSAKAYYSIGCALENQRQFEQAIDQFQVAIRYKPDMALAHEALGRTLIAQERLSDAQAALSHALDVLPNGVSMRNHVVAQADRCEKLLALENRFPEIVKGTANAANQEEQLLFADICFIKQHYAAATRYYAEVFPDTPQATDDLYMRQGYQAARAAALASRGTDRDGAPINDVLNDAEQLSYAQQARKWLTASLAAWTARFDRGPIKDRPTILRVLSEWPCNPDLSCLRDEQMLQRLRPEEADKCRILWRDLDSVLNRAQDPN